MNINNASLIIYNTLTPTHVGSGTELSYIDLPIQRETHTGFPKIEASTIKGCLRPILDNTNHDLDQLLGNPNHGDYASAVSFTDARLLFFPVKSVSGVFAWITCPLALARFQKDCQQFIDEESPLLKWTALSDQGNLVSDAKSNLIISGNKIMLEDYLFTVKSNEDFTQFISTFSERFPLSDDMQKRFSSHVVLLDDDDFAHFVKYATEVNTRIKINPQTGTVDGTALFTEEFLPPESILYSLIFYDNAYKPQNAATETTPTAANVEASFLDKLKKVSIFQIGADRSLGKGLVEFHLWEAKKK